MISCIFNNSISRKPSGRGSVLFGYFVLICIVCLILTVALCGLGLWFFSPNLIMPDAEDDAIPMGNTLSWSESVFALITEAKGDVFAVSMVHRDITERLKVIEKKERFI